MPMPGLQRQHTVAVGGESARACDATDGTSNVCKASVAVEPASSAGSHASRAPLEPDVAANVAAPVLNPAEVEHVNADDANEAGKPFMSASERTNSSVSHAKKCEEGTANAQPSPPLESNDSGEGAELYTSEANSLNYPGTVASSKEFKSRITGAFITSEDNSNVDEPYRMRAASILSSNITETIIGLAVAFNLFIMCLDTDARADQPDSPGREPATWVTIVNFLLWLLFALELALRFAVERWATFSKPDNWLDCVIVVSGAFEAILHFVGSDFSGVGMVRMLRLCRLLRLVRVLKLFKVVKELNRLIQMMGSCFRTLFWSTSLLGLVMIVWACIAVEFINPHVQELAEQHGYWDDCERCQRSFSTVFNACLTLFQTIIAGDSWGTVAVPVIENYPLAALVLCGALMTLVFGVLNLIVAVIVDTFAEKRAKDVVTIAQDLETAEREEKNALGKIFEKIDENMDGTLTFNELEEGAKRVAEFRHWLRVLDIDSSDLHNLFVMVDEDGSGEIDPSEFIDAMYRIKNSESKTVMRFVKHLVTTVVQTQTDMAMSLGSLQTRMTEVTSNLGKVMELRDQQKEVDEPGNSVEETDAAQVRQDLDKAMAEASQVAFEAALEAAGSVARTVDEMRNSIDKDYDLPPQSSMSAQERRPSGRWMRNSRRDAMQFDQLCSEHKSPQALDPQDHGSHVQDKRHPCGGHALDRESTSARSLATSPYVRHLEATVCQNKVLESSASQTGMVSRSAATSKTSHANLPVVTASGGPTKFGPKHWLSQTASAIGDDEPSSQERTSKRCPPDCQPQVAPQDHPLL